MKFLRAFLLWILSLGAFLAALGLFVGAIVAQTQNIAASGRLQWILFSAVVALGGFAALTFASASNPWLSQRFGFLKSNRARWTFSITAILVGAVALVGIFFSGLHALQASDADPGAVRARERIVEACTNHGNSSQVCQCFVDELPADLHVRFERYQSRANLESRAELRAEGESPLRTALDIRDAQTNCGATPWWQ